VIEAVEQTENFGLADDTKGRVAENRRICRGKGDKRINRKQGHDQRGAPSGLRGIAGGGGREGGNV